MFQRSSIIEAAEQYISTHKKDFVTLYDFQKEFINNGKEYKQRAFCGGNR